MEARRRLPCDADALESVQLKNFSAEVSCLGSHILSRYVPSTEESHAKSRRLVDQGSGGLPRHGSGFGHLSTWVRQVIMSWFLFMPI